MEIKDSEDLRLLLQGYRNSVELNTIVLERLSALTACHNELRIKVDEQHGIISLNVTEVKDKFLATMSGMKMQLYIGLVGSASIILLLIKVVVYKGGIV